MVEVVEEEVVAMGRRGWGWVGGTEPHRTATGGEADGLVVEKGKGEHDRRQLAHLPRSRQIGGAQGSSGREISGAQRSSGLTMRLATLSQ